MPAGHRAAPLHSRGARERNGVLPPASRVRRTAQLRNGSAGLDGESISTITSPGCCQSSRIRSSSRKSEAQRELSRRSATGARRIPQPGGDSEKPAAQRRSRRAWRGRTRTPTRRRSRGGSDHFALQDIFVKGLESLDPTQAMSEEDIRTAIQNAAGTKAVLLLPEEPFENLVKQAIWKMSDPCQKCARLVHDELGRIARQLIAAQDLQRYPRLAQSIEDATRDFFCEGLAPAEAMISSLVDCQLAHINTSHPDFVGGSKALRLAQTEVSKRRGWVRSGERTKRTRSSLQGVRDTCWARRERCSTRWMRRRKAEEG